LNGAGNFRVGWMGGTVGGMIARKRSGRGDVRLQRQWERLSVWGCGGKRGVMQGFWRGDDDGVMPKSLTGLRTRGLRAGRSARRAGRAPRPPRPVGRRGTKLVNSAMNSGRLRPCPGPSPGTAEAGAVLPSAPMSLFIVVFPSPSRLRRGAAAPTPRRISH
jgi:hypothetical protein